MARMDWAVCSSVMMTSHMPPLSTPRRPGTLVLPPDAIMTQGMCFSFSGLSATTRWFKGWSTTRPSRSIQWAEMSPTAPALSRSSTSARDTRPTLVMVQVGVSSPTERKARSTFSPRSKISFSMGWAISRSRVDCVSVSAGAAT